MDNSINNTILLAGSTGYIGRHVLTNLLSRGYRVVCLGRNFTEMQTLKNHKNLSFYKINLCSKSDFKNLSSKISSLHAVISCIGTRSWGYLDSWNIEYRANKNLLEFGKFLKIKQFILLSAICVQKPKLEFQFAKLAFENYLKNSNVTYSIVRPTAFFKSISGQIEKVKSGKSFIFFDNGTTTSCKPISERNLAEFICDCLVIDHRNNKILPIGGSGANTQSYIIFDPLASGWRRFMGQLCLDNGDLKYTNGEKMLGWARSNVFETTQGYGGNGQAFPQNFLNSSDGIRNHLFRGDEQLIDYDPPDNDTIGFFDLPAIDWGETHATDGRYLPDGGPFGWLMGNNQSEGMVPVSTDSSSNTLAIATMTYPQSQISEDFPLKVSFTWLTSCPALAITRIGSAPRRWRIKSKK